MSHDPRGFAAMVRRAQLASLLLLGCVSLVLAADKAAEQLQQLGDDFLEYLGSLEGEDDSWMDFVAEAGNEAAKPQAQLVSSNTSSASSSASSATSSPTPPREPAASVNTSAASRTGKVEK